MNLLELDISSLYCQGEFQYPLTLTKFIMIPKNMLENLLVRISMQVYKYS